MWIKQVELFKGVGENVFYKLRNLKKDINEWLEKNTHHIINKIECMGDSKNPYAMIEYEEFKEK